MARAGGQRERKPGLGFSQSQEHSAASGQLLVSHKVCSCPLHLGSAPGAVQGDPDPPGDKIS